MGLALEEPREEDEKYRVDDIPVVVDPFASKIIRESGGISIRSSMFGPTAELNGTGCSGGSCSCG